MEAIVEMRHHRKVTLEDLATFAEMASAGADCHEISRKTGFSLSAVKRHCEANGIELRRLSMPLWTEQELEIVRNGLERNLTAWEIAAQCGRSIHAVRAKIGESRARRKMESLPAQPGFVSHFEPASITAALMGDPPPHRSALGRDVQPHEYASRGGEGRFRACGDGLARFGA